MKKIFSFLVRWKYLTAAFVVLVVVVAVVAARSPEPAPAAEAAKKEVEVIHLADLQSDGGTIPLVGTLQSFQQLDVRPQMPGQVSAVWVKLGQTVYPGQIMAELSHRDLDAAVAQAQAQVSSAVAQLEKMKSGARAEDLVILEQSLAAARQQLEDMQNGARPQEIAIAKANLDAAQNALRDAEISLQQTEQQNTLNSKKVVDNGALFIRSAQLSLEKILEQDLTVLFDDNNGDRVIPHILETILLNQVNDLRADVEFKLDLWKQQTAALAAQETVVVDALNRTNTELESFLSFLDLTSKMLQEAHATPEYDSTDIASAKSTVNTARATVKGLIDSVSAQLQAIQQQPLANEQSLTSARTRVSQAQASLASAQEQYDIAVKGATPEQVRIQEAQVAQAEQQLAIAKNGARPEDIRVQEAAIASARASLALAAANREKALVRAPIGGKVTYLPIKIGDVVSSSSIALSLASENGLQVETFVSERERAFLSVGNTATINETHAGTISEIAPALDPVNRKVKVIVTLNDKQIPLTLGETVRVALTKNTPEESKVQLPLTAVKFKTEGTELLGVKDGLIQAVPVEIGAVSANTIDVVTALDPEIVIVKDVRGLRAGQEVIVK